MIGNENGFDINHPNTMQKLMSCLSPLILVATFIYGTPCFANELSDLKDRVKELEERFDDEVSFQRDEHLNFFNQMNEGIKLNMYIGLEFESFETTHSGFKADSFELVSELNFKDKMTAFFEIEFKGKEAEIEQGWFEYLIDPLFNLRMGAILVPFGAYNLDHFNYQRELSSRPIAMRHIVPVTWREAGIGLTGNLFIENEGGRWIDEIGLDYQFFVINGMTEKFKTNSSRGARGIFNGDSNDNKAVVSRIGLTLNSENVLGLSAYHGEYHDHLGSQISGLNFDWSFLHGPFEFLGEYARFNLEKTLPEIPKKLQGGYAQINYHFWPKFFNTSFLGKGHENPAFSLVLRHGEAIIQGAFDKNEERRWTVGINYRPYHTFVSRIEYQWNETRNQAIEHGNKNGLIVSFAAAF